MSLIIRSDCQRPPHNYDYYYFKSYDTPLKLLRMTKKVTLVQRFLRKIILLQKYATYHWYL